jgi:hypothetical protein
MENLLELGKIRNKNVRTVALGTQEAKDSKTAILMSYSEAYGGESA